MTEPETIASATFYPGDCLEVLPTLADNSIDACVTDPPYHLTSIVGEIIRAYFSQEQMTMLAI